MVDVFFSYSHRDEQLRNELEIHLAMLKRQGIVSAWHDRRIGAGAEIDSEISEHLESADIILLLLSPYFLASDYCYEIEATRALAKHDSGESVVIPVILEPCDWLNSPFRRLKATPTDGKPVSKFANIHDAFLEVTTDIRDAAKKLGKEDLPTPSEMPRRQASPASNARSSNLRVKREFTDRDRDKYIDDGFAYISNFFENSLNELSSRHANLEYRFKQDGDTSFTAAIYIAGQKRTSCRIWSQGRNAFGGDIAYSASDSGSGSGFNESMSVADDGYTLGFRPMGMGMVRRQSEGLLTPHGAAEYYWGLLVGPLQ